MSTFRLSRLSACLLLAASPPLYAETSQSHPPRSLETIDVTAAPSGGDYDAGMTTEGRDSYTTDATNTATRMVLSPRETPQSVTVITREQMEDFGLNSVAEVMQRTPGVTVNAQDTERLQFFARGFEITNFLYDGMPSMRNSSLGKQAAQADTFIYDRVEVLRGASGLLHGIGNPSATINLVRKKPTRDFSGQVGVEANSWNGYRGELDVGGPIDGNDKVRARFVSAYEQGESFLDHYENEKQVFYGVIEGDISDSTMITLGMDYMDYDPEGSTWGGIPLFYSDGGIADLDRDTNPATDWSSWAQDARTAFMHLEHQFDSGWYGKLAYTYQENNYDAQLASAGGGTLNRDGSGKTLWSGRFQEEKHQDTFDLYANGPFELFGRQHELVVGASHSRAKRDYTGQPALNFDNTLDNLFTWDGNRAKPAWGANNAEEKELIEQTGFYATARFKPTDSLAVITGGRVVDWERSRSGFNWAGPFPDHERHFEENGEVVPFAGVVYDLNQHHSVYASYTSIFQPQTARDIDNRVLDPEEGNSYEAGLKSEFRDGRVNTTVAVFRTDQEPGGIHRPADSRRPGQFRCLPCRGWRTDQWFRAGSLRRNPASLATAGRLHLPDHRRPGRRRAEHLLAGRYAAAVHTLPFQWQPGRPDPGHQHCLAEQDLRLRDPPGPQWRLQVRPGRLHPGGPDGPLSIQPGTVGHRQCQQPDRRDIFQQPGIL